MLVYFFMFCIKRALAVSICDGYELLHRRWQYILLLLESLTNSLAVFQKLLGTFVDTVVLLGGQVGGGEVVDTVLETSGDQVRVQSHEVFHLLLLNNLLKLLLFFDV